MPLLLAPSRLLARDCALQARIAGAINLTRTTRAERGLNLVRPELGARGEGHRARFAVGLTTLSGWSAIQQ
jgi:hypothetical protein